jgi:hypothetical protein
MNYLYLLGPLSLSPWQNNEIRYSLRSVGALDRRARIFIAGPEVPDFLSAITHIPVEIKPVFGKYKNMQRQLKEACEAAHVPEDLLLMNDDFLIRKTPVWDWSTTYTGMIPKHDPRKPGNRWRRSLVATGVWLQGQGIEEPRCYEGHTPMPFEKTKALPILRRLIVNEKDLQFRSAYGNLVDVGGKLHPNAKRSDPEKWPEDSPFWSLKSNVNEKAKTFLATWLAKPSPWENQNG